jgi:hypothetical protein
MISLGYSALKATHTKGSGGNNRITQWESRLGENDYLIHGRPDTDPTIGGIPGRRLIDAMLKPIGWLPTDPKAKLNT